MLLVVTETSENEPPKLQTPLVSSSVFGMVLFVITEVMFFAGLISAYMIIRAGTTEWPPWGQPRLPVMVTAVNTLILLSSALTMYLSQRFISQNLANTKRLLGLTVLLGMTFVTIQGYEWQELIRFGLTIVSSPYGGLFYLIIGAHAVHITAALLYLIKFYFRIDPVNPQFLDQNNFLATPNFLVFCSWNLACALCLGLSRLVKKFHNCSLLDSCGYFL